MNAADLDEAYRWADQGIAAIFKAKKVVPCCREGCHWCCDEPAYVHKAEAEHMLAALTPEKREMVRAQTRTWADQAQASGLLPEPEINALEWRAQGITCPFIENGRCAAYAQRPYACRSFFAIGDPMQCQSLYREHQTFLDFGAELNARLVAPEMALLAQGTKELVLRQMGVWLAEILLGRQMQDCPKTIDSKTVLILCRHLMKDATARLEQMARVGVAKRY
jgi:Fe-S-cluster containining protein